MKKILRDAFSGSESKGCFVYSPKVPDYLLKHTQHTSVCQSKKGLHSKSPLGMNSNLSQPFDTNYNAARKIWWNNTREKNALSKMTL